MLSAIDLVTSKVETRALHEDTNESGDDSDEEEEQEIRVFMVGASINCLYIFLTIYSLTQGSTATLGSRS